MRQPRCRARRRVHERQPSLVDDSQEPDQDAFRFVEAGRFRARQTQDALAQAMDRFRAHAVRDRPHIGHREPSLVAVPELEAHQIPIGESRVRRRPEHERAVRPALRVEPHAPVRRGLGLKFQVDIHANRWPGRAAAHRRIERLRQWIIEITLFEMKRPAAANSRRPALELLPVDGDPGAGERRQGGFEAVVLDQRPNVGLFDPGVAQQLRVRIARARVHDTAEDPQEPRLARAHALDDARRASSGVTTCRAKARRPVAMRTSPYSSAGIDISCWRGGEGCYAWMALVRVATRVLNSRRCDVRRVRAGRRSGTAREFYAKPRRIRL